MLKLKIRGLVYVLFMSAVFSKELHIKAYTTSELNMNQVDFLFEL